MTANYGIEKTVTGITVSDSMVFLPVWVWDGIHHLRSRQRAQGIGTISDRNTVWDWYTGNETSARNNFTNLNKIKNSQLKSTTRPRLTDSQSRQARQAPPAGKYHWHWPRHCHTVTESECDVNLQSDKSNVNEWMSGPANDNVNDYKTTKPEHVTTKAISLPLTLTLAVSVSQTQKSKPSRSASLTRRLGSAQSHSESDRDWQFLLTWNIKEIGSESSKNRTVHEYCISS